jgi:hypothetical protein
MKLKNRKLASTIFYDRIFFPGILLCWFLISPSKLFSQTDTTSSSGEIAIISDLQEPMRIEEIYLKSNHNTKATRMLLHDIETRKPAQIYLLGDIVNLSFKNKRWELIDSCLTIFRTDGIPVHACLGNHELMENKKTGEKNFQTRFPDHINTGYTVIYDSVATVFLNSNFSKMGKAQIIEQDHWYKKELFSLDSLKSVLAIVVCCHHSPYSDSKMVGSSEPVQEKFVPLFLNTKKCKLFVSGHAHIFQHFNIRGKDFLVIGGGGGLNHPLKKKSCGETDLAKNYKPMFHYITLHRKDDTLKVVSRKLKEDFSEVEDGLRFEINLRN